MLDTPDNQLFVLVMSQLCVQAAYPISNELRSLLLSMETYPIARASLCEAFGAFTVNNIYCGILFGAVGRKTLQRRLARTRALSLFNCYLLNWAAAFLAN